MYRILRGGYNCRHERGLYLEREKGVDYYVLLLVKSPAGFRIGNREFAVEGDCGVLIPPHVPYDYRGRDCEYINDWIHFECEDADFPEKYKCLLGCAVPLNNSQQFSTYFHQILWEFNYALPEFKAQSSSLLLQVLLNKLFQEASGLKETKGFPYAAGLQKIRLAMQSQPEMDVTAAQMAEQLGISPSYFQALYREFFGVPFKQDLIDMRVDYARYLLKSTNIKLDRLADMCGYTNEVHFYRQFREKVGMTPREYMRSENGL